MVESTSTPASIAREAKALTQSLKDSLKKHEPWEREIEFQRTNLRRQFLQLLFVHPYAKESKDADHSLWLTTSYFIISAYKQRIAAADAVIHQTANEYHGHRGQDRHHGKPTGVVEHRKLVHRFRQFLAEEEKFWTSLVVRSVRVFNLDEARSALAALNIQVGDETENGALETSPSKPDRRNIFPSEDATTPPTPSQKEQKLIMLSKALVCLGDIARYREHYNEGGGRPRAGKDFHDDIRGGRGRGGRRAVEQPPRPRNYGKAQECYERARLLVPDVGNACHQLAILASYQQDPFAGVLQYYRAMCVKLPYETAAANLDSTLARNLEIYKNTLTKTEGSPNEAPKMKVERYKKSLVALHGLWKHSRADAEKQLPNHADNVISTFSTLVKERILPTDIIWKTVIIALGALWRFRILRDPHSKRDPKRAAATEARIFTHILRVMQALFRIGCEQIAEASNSPDPSVNGTPLAAGETPSDLAQNITAVFRRTLPALRIGSKWLSVHFTYTAEAPSRLDEHLKDGSVQAVVKEFWESYDAFGKQLGKVFPVEELPKLAAPLEEDVEVNGFAPLKRATLERSANTASGLEPGQSQVHPNEEQLMRIADLLADRETLMNLRARRAQEMAVAEPVVIPKEESVAVNAHPRVVNAPLPPPALTGPGFPSRPIFSSVSGISSAIEKPELEAQSEVEDDAATVSTKTEDDPVNLVNMVIKAAQYGEDEEEDDVVYLKDLMQRPAPIAPPVNVAPATNTSNAFPTTPVIAPNPNPIASPAKISKPVSPNKPVTAEDLVNEMLRPRTSTTDSLSRVLVPPPGSPLPATAPLLFPSASPNAPTSIWSTTTHDSVSLSAGNLRSGYPGAQTRVSPPVMSLSPYSVGLSGNAPVSVSGGGTLASGMGPTRPIGYGHQRHVSQPLAFPPAPPTGQGLWGSQGASQLSSLASSQSQSQTRHNHNLSPLGSQRQMLRNSVGPQTISPTPSFLQLQQLQSELQQQPQQTQGGMGMSGLSNIDQLSNGYNITSLNSGLPIQNTWSLSGLDEINALGPYGQSRMQQQAPLHRSGSWAPT